MVAWRQWCLVHTYACKIIGSYLQFLQFSKTSIIYWTEYERVFTHEIEECADVIIRWRNWAMIRLTAFDVIRCSTFKPVQGELYFVHEWWPLNRSISSSWRGLSPMYCLAASAASAGVLRATSHKADRPLNQSMIECWPFWTSHIRAVSHLWHCIINGSVHRTVTTRMNCSWKCMHGFKEYYSHNSNLTLGLLTLWD